MQSPNYTLTCHLANLHTSFYKSTFVVFAVCICLWFTIIVAAFSKISLKLLPDFNFEW